jgi:hypothetical protein
MQLFTGITSGDAQTKLIDLFFSLLFDGKYSLENLKKVIIALDENEILKYK